MPDSDAVAQYLSGVEAALVLSESEKAVPAPPRCADGHLYPAGSAFCPSCGAKVGVPSGVRSMLSVEMAAQVGDPRRPKPDALLTDEERAERMRLHRYAVREGSKDVAPVFEPTPPDAETFLIHFLEDGFTAFGVVWYRGQELAVPIGSPRWEQGKRWLIWQDAEQMERCGKVYFRRGPWPGKKSYTEALGGFEQLTTADGTGKVTGPSVEDLIRADKIEAGRRRGVPRIVSR